MARERWGDGAAYERYIGRWSRSVAIGFIDWLGVPPGAAWIDVGCGTGALSEWILGTAEPSSLLGVDPSAGFVAIAAERLAGRGARFEVGTADALPASDGAADAVVSGLVIPFVPDVPAALAEARRTVRPGGIVAGYVWDYAGRMELIRRFFDAAISVGADGALDHDEGRRFPIASPDGLAGAWADAGLQGVEVIAIDVPTRFADFDDFWEPFTHDVGAAPVYLARLPADQQEAIRKRLRSTLPFNPDGSIDLIARAWAVRGCH